MLQMSLPRALIVGIFCIAIAWPAEPAGTTGKAEPPGNRGREEDAIRGDVATCCASRPPSTSLAQARWELKRALNEIERHGKQWTEAEYHAHMSHAQNLYVAVLKATSHDGPSVSAWSRCWGLSSDRLTSWTGYEPRMVEVFARCRGSGKPDVEAPDELTQILHYGATQLPGRHNPQADAVVQLIRASAMKAGCIDPKFRSKLAHEMQANSKPKDALEAAGKQIYGSDGYSIALNRIEACHKTLSS